MRIEITSTTDTPANVRAALGQTEVPKTEAGKDDGAKSSQSAPAEATQPEQKQSEESDTSETETKAEKDDASDADPDKGEESEEQSTNDKPKKGKGGFQKRIEKLTAKRAEAERERDYWRNVATQKKDATEADNKPVESPVSAKGEPQPDDFETHTQFVKALTKWEIDQRDQASKAEQQKSKLISEQQALTTAYAERVKSFVEKTEDYHDVIDGAENVPMSATMQQVFITSEYGPALAYEMAKNPEEAARIAELSPISAARELGKIEARLSAKDSGEKKPNKTTKAPKPLDPVGSRGASVDKDIYDAATMSQKDYERSRAKQRADAAKAG